MTTTTVTSIMNQRYHPSVTFINDATGIASLCPLPLKPLTTGILEIKL